MTPFASPWSLTTVFHLREVMLSEVFSASNYHHDGWMKRQQPTEQKTERNLFLSASTPSSRF